MRDMPQATIPAHAPSDHPAIARGKVGLLLANLGTPDGYGYWPMRRYLSEFLSDKRVIDYPSWKWQPLLQAIILTNLGETQYRTEKPAEAIETLKQAEEVSSSLGDRILEGEILRGLAKAHMLKLMSKNKPKIVYAVVSEA